MVEMNSTMQSLKKFKLIKYDYYFIKLKTFQFGPR